MIVTITISGPQGSGKTVLAGYIARGLIKNSIRVSMSSGARRRSKRPDQTVPALANLSQKGLQVVIEERPEKVQA